MLSAAKSWEYFLAATLLRPKMTEASALFECLSISLCFVPMSWPLQSLCATNDFFLIHSSQAYVYACKKKGGGKPNFLWACFCLNHNPILLLDKCQEGEAMATWFPTSLPPGRCSYHLLELFNVAMGSVKPEALFSVLSPHAFPVTSGPAGSPRTQSLVSLSFMTVLAPFLLSLVLLFISLCFSSAYSSLKKGCHPEFLF